MGLNTHGLQLHLAPVDTSPKEAREKVALALADAVDSSRRFEIELLVSELVTNAVLHAATPVDVEVAIDRGVVHVKVSDAAEVMPRAAAPADEATSGRGLRLVEGLADRWGIEPRDRGKVVWFEMATG